MQTTQDLCWPPRKRVPAASSEPILATTMLADVDNERELIGKIISSKYLVDEIIGVGGMGTVYRARQLSLDRLVALKVLHARCSGDAQYVARFRVEALAASRLEHPNSVRILDFGQDDDVAPDRTTPLLFLAMEYVGGRTLLDIIERHWPLPHRQTIDLLCQVLSALAVAHDLGIVHRDLKPENVLVCDGIGDDGQRVDVAKVCDFGIAKLTTPPGTAGALSSIGPFLRRTTTAGDRGAAADCGTDAGNDGNGGRHTSKDIGRITLAGTVIGTPDYFSPEQARAEPLDARSDLYSLGVVLYYLLAGRLPFVGANPLAVSFMQATAEPPPPSQFMAVPPAMEAICLKAMAKDPAQRFQNAREMRAALRALIDQPVARAVTVIRPASRSSLPMTSWTTPLRSVKMKAAIVAFAAAGALAAAIAEPWLKPALQASPTRGGMQGSAGAGTALGVAMTVAESPGNADPPPPTRRTVARPVNHRVERTVARPAPPTETRRSRRPPSWRSDDDAVLPPSFMAQ